MTTRYRQLQAEDRVTLTAEVFAQTLKQTAADKKKSPPRPASDAGPAANSLALLRTWPPLRPQVTR